MKKKILLFVSLLAGLLFFVSTPTYASKIPKGYGIAKVFTTPKATRGTWYYREKGDKNISKVKITAHTIDGKKLYVPSQTFFKKNVYNVSTKKRNQFIKKTQNIYAGSLYKKGFNVNNWVNLAGAGDYYIPVTRTVNGKKVKALRLATGAGPYTAAYAYKNKALVK